MTEEQANQLQYIYDRTLNNGTQISTCMDLGTGTSFNVKSFSGYDKFTTNNFLINTFATTSLQAPGTEGYNGNEYGKGTMQLVKSYDTSTGTLTAYIKFTVNTLCAYGANLTTTKSSNVPVQVFIVF